MADDADPHYPLFMAGTGVVGHQAGKPFVHALKKRLRAGDLANATRRSLWQLDAHWSVSDLGFWKTMPRHLVLAACQAAVRHRMLCPKTTTHSMETYINEALARRVGQLIEDGTLRGQAARGWQLLMANIEYMQRRVQEELPDQRVRGVLFRLVWADYCSTGGFHVDGVGARASVADGNGARIIHQTRKAETVFLSDVFQFKRTVTTPPGGCFGTTGHVRGSTAWGRQNTDICHAAAPCPGTRAQLIFDHEDGAEASADPTSLSRLMRLQQRVLQELCQKHALDPTAPAMLALDLDWNETETETRHGDVREHAGSELERRRQLCKYGDGKLSFLQPPTAAGS